MIPKSCPTALNKRSALLIIFAIVFLAPSFVAADLTPGRSDTGFNVGTGSDNAVMALAVELDGGILVGGAFSQINGLNQPNLARLEKDGTPTAFNPQVDYVVFAITVQPDLKILIGGLFTKVNGVNRPGIARLNRDGTLDNGFVPALTYTTGLNSINSMVLQPDGKILVSGDFKSGSNQYLVRLNADGSLDTGFQTGSGLNGAPYRVALQPDGRILVGGTFTLVNGISRNHIARLNADGSLDTGFNPGTGTDGNVKAIVIQPDHKILIGGNFQAVNGIPRKHLARLNPDGSPDMGFTADLDNFVEDLVLTSDGRLLAAGNFSPPTGCPSCQFVVRYLAGTGSPDPAFTPVSLTGSTVLRITVQHDGGILIGGSFDVTKPMTLQKNIARLNSDGTLDIGFREAAVDGWVMAAVVDNWGKTYLGGLFQNWLDVHIFPPIFTIPRNSIIRLNGDGTCDLSFNPGAGANGWVFALALESDRSLYLGGSFTQVNNIPHGGIAKLNPDGSLNGAFNPLGVDTGGSVGAIVIQPDQKILLGGVFQKMNVFDRKNLARMTAAGAVDTGFVADTNADVLALALQLDGKILVGGKFTQVNSSPRSFLSRVNADGALDSTFTPQVDNEVWTIKIQLDGKILIGGAFTTVSGQPRSGIARLLPDGTLDLAFNPGTGANWPVASITLQSDGRMVIGGMFSTFNGVGRPGIARINPDGSLHQNFNPGAGAGGAFPLVKTVVASRNSKVLIGGTFDQFDGVTRYFVARLNGQTPPAFTGPPIGPAEVGQTFQHDFQADGMPLPKFQITAGTPPPGLSLNETTGLLSGIPQQVGTFPLTITAYNQFPPVASQAFTLTVDQTHIYLPLLLRQ